MNEMYIFAVLAGVALGVFFFLGLWFTVQKGLQAQNPALWFLASFVLRMSIVVISFYWLAQLGKWQYVVIALAGFIVTRMILSYFLGGDKNTVGTNGVGINSDSVAGNNTNKENSLTESTHAP